MQVGDLVELSANGKKLQLNEHAVGKTGLVAHCYDYGEAVPGWTDKRDATWGHPDTYCLDILWSGTSDVVYQHPRNDLKLIK